MACPKIELRAMSPDITSALTKTRERLAQLQFPLDVSVGFDAERQVYVTRLGHVPGRGQEGGRVELAVGNVPALMQLLESLPEMLPARRALLQARDGLSLGSRALH